ncbi:MAG: DegT/DnrJ/EryC1/StrS family aminotransferase [Chloroflexi bacterium]|nr:DegT/DnrJ/EryC1/StrS family aminotransferase [Chloroflexota bacterium]
MAKLAIEGGTPLRSSPFPRRILVGEEEIDAVTALMQKERTNGGGFDRYGGEHVDAYEREFAEFHGMRYATAVSSGTAAIHTALGALRLDIAQEVISSPITDPGGVAPILWNNCIPIFADTVPETMNMAPASLEARITPRTKAIIVTHLTGQPAQIDQLSEIARAHGIPLIEDCAQAHGARFGGQLVGSFGDLSAFSLMGGKHHTAGGQGGMVLTNDEELYWNAKRFADRGKPFNSTAIKNLFLGNNYRMTELEAVIGRVQLKKLPQVAAKRRALASKLQEGIRDLQAVRMQHVIEGVEPTYWLMLLHIDPQRLRTSKADFVAACNAEGMPIDLHYDCIAYESPWFRERANYGSSECPWSCPFYGHQVQYEGSCPDARRAIEAHFVLPWHEGYSEREVEDIAAILSKVEAAYLR